MYLYNSNGLLVVNTLASERLMIGYTKDESTTFNLFLLNIHLEWKPFCTGIVLVVSTLLELSDNALWSQIQLKKVSN